MARATTLLAHTGVLQTYEEGLKEQEPKDLPPKQTNQHKKAEKPITPNLSKSKLDNLPENKEKDKMPPMERQPSNPLKHIDELLDELLATHIIHTAGVLKK